MIVDESGISSLPVSLPQEDVDSFLSKIKDLSEQINTDETYRGLLKIFADFSDSMDGNSPLDRQIFNTLGDINLGVLGKRVFVMSYGHGLHINPLRKFQINLFRPSHLFWYYPSTTHSLFADRTIVIDPNPVRIRIMDGRQIGIMKRFIGIYVFIPGKSTMENTVFFVGYAYRVMGLDLSPTSK
jgi:hypothetical protein